MSARIVSAFTTPKRSEKGNPALAAKFNEADKNHDGKLSRAEYLAVMTKQDATTAKNKIERALDKDDNEAGQGSTSPAK